MLIHSASQLLTIPGPPQRGRELGRLGLIGNGPDGTIGKHDMDRVQRMIDSLVPVFGNPEVNIEILEGLTAKDIASNEFIDDSIGLS